MNIKRTVKIAFALIVILFLIISSINYLIFNQLKENNLTKNTITKLISLQESMNLLLKDAKNSKDIKKLVEIKTHFNKYEKLFEKVKKDLLSFEHNELLDLMREDLHDNKEIVKAIKKLIKNEKTIEIAFDKIFNMQNEYINLAKKIEYNYKDEKAIRKLIENNILKSQNMFLIHHLGNMKYYSKEALFQYKDKKSLDRWLVEIDTLTDKNSKKTDLIKYKVLAKDIGNKVIRLAQIDNSIEDLKKEIRDILRTNRLLNEKIMLKIEDISNNFFDFIYNIMILLLLFALVFVSFVAFYVSKHVGLSVDEIEEKVNEATLEIENLNKEIEETQREVVFTMGAIGERRSKETGNHVKRVAEYSKILALHYGLDEKEAQMLKEASPMHDIGKVAIPDSILNKPGPFDPEERKIMETHATLGYEMLKSSKRALLKMAAIVAYEHHEKWDGTGYPRGLKGEEIHIYGRITAVADVFDALGSDRVYKKAWDDERIFKLFKEERGKQFDPSLIDIFFENLDQFLEVRDRFKDIIIKNKS